MKEMIACKDIENCVLMVFKKYRVEHKIWTESECINGSDSKEERLVELKCFKFWNNPNFQKKQSKCIKLGVRCVRELEGGNGRWLWPKYIVYMFKRLNKILFKCLLTIWKWATIWFSPCFWMSMVTQILCETVDSRYFVSKR